MRYRYDIRPARAARAARATRARRPQPGGQQGQGGQSDRENAWLCGQHMTLRAWTAEPHTGQYCSCLDLGVYFIQTLTVYCTAYCIVLWIVANHDSILDRPQCTALTVRYCCALYWRYRRGGQCGYCRAAELLLSSTSRKFSRYSIENEYCTVYEGSVVQHDHDCTPHTVIL